METKAKGISEDWLSLWLGLAIFILSLFTFGGVDLLGWGINTSVWTNVSKALSPVSATYKDVKGEISKIEGNQVTVKKSDGKEATVTVPDAAALKVGAQYEKKGVSGFAALIYTYLFLLVLMTISARFLGANLGHSG